MALVAAIWMAFHVRSPHHLREGAFSGPLGLVAAALAAAMIAAVVLGAGLMFTPTAAFVALTLALHRCFPTLSLPGASLYAVEIFGLLAGTLWTILFIAEFGLPKALEIAAAVAVVCGWVLMAFSSFERIARQAVLTHTSWKLPFIAAAKAPAKTTIPRTAIIAQLPGSTGKNRSSGQSRPRMRRAPDTDTVCSIFVPAVKRCRRFCCHGVLAGRIGITHLPLVQVLSDHRRPRDRG